MSARLRFYASSSKKRDERGADIGSVQQALVGAEALPESLRSWFREHGVPHVFQTYASADIGSIAYETATEGVLDPGMVLDEEVLLEIVRPGTGEPVAPGDIGEVVVTAVQRRLSADPLCHRRSIRAAGRAPARACAPTAASKAGWGAPTRPPRCARCSCTPSQVQNIVRRHPEILKARLMVSGQMANDA